MKITSKAFQLEKHKQTLWLLAKIAIIATIYLIAVKHGFSEDHFASGKKEFEDNVGSDSTAQFYLMGGAAIWSAYKAIGDWTVKQAAGNTVTWVVLIYVINAVVFG